MVPNPVKNLRDTLMQFENMPVSLPLHENNISKISQ